MRVAPPEHDLPRRSPNAVSGQCVTSEACRLAHCEFVPSCRFGPDTSCRGSLCCHKALFRTYLYLGWAYNEVDVVSPADISSEPAFGSYPPRAQAKREKVACWNCSKYGCFQ